MGTLWGHCGGNGEDFVGTLWGKRERLCGDTDETVENCGIIVGRHWEDTVGHCGDTVQETAGTLWGH